MANGIRGARTLTLFELEEVAKEVKEDGRGRSPELIELRDEHLLYRYAYYASDRRNAYMWIVEELGREFYLTPSTVGQIIARNTEVLYRIKEEKLTMQELNKKYPPRDWKQINK